MPGPLEQLVASFAVTLPCMDDLLLMWLNRIWKVTNPIYPQCWVMPSQVNSTGHLISLLLKAWHFMVTFFPPVCCGLHLKHGGHTGKVNGPMWLTLFRVSP